MSQHQEPHRQRSQHYQEEAGEYEWKQARKHCSPHLSPLI